MISGRPRVIGLKEQLLLLYGPDATEYPQQRSKRSSGFSLGCAPQPPLPFPLDVLKAALDLHLRPDLTYCTDHRTLSIHNNIKRFQAPIPQRSEPYDGRYIAFFRLPDMRDDLLGQDIHQADVTAVLVKISPIIDEILRVAEVEGLDRWLSQLMRNNPPKRARAVAGESAQFADRVALINPVPEPSGLSIPLKPRDLPRVGLAADGAAISRLALLSPTVSLNVVDETERAVFFFAS